MNDRKLLELAAKAAGCRYDNEVSCYHDERGHIWSPLLDDGDALRLAVKLRLEIDIHHTWIAVRTPNGIKVLIDADKEPDAYAATRRAIVRAAAEIGKAKP